MPAKKKPGRPDLLTPERKDRIISMIRQGVFIETACEANGIGKTTYYRWLERADDPASDPKYREFRDATNTARAEAESRHVLRVEQASRNDWKASAWFLERSFPTKYGKQQRIEHTGADGGAISLAGLESLMGVAESGDDE